MTFTDHIFLIGLLPWLIVLFYVFREKQGFKRLLLLLANTTFYLWGGLGAFIVIMILSLLTWFFCRVSIITKNKLIFGMECLLLLTPLLIFKYTTFFVENINYCLNIQIQPPSWIMPIGISFFTFEAISCLCDTYNNKYIEKLSYVDLYLYLSFFPTVASGPILRIKDFKNGIKQKVSFEQYSDSIERIAIGIIKKVLLADKVAILADYYFQGIALGGSYSLFGLWIGSIAYTLQLYFDFSGYSDMAIGIGSLLGFSIPENFNKPYQASSIQEFWKSWHISLSQWFRDYVYIPLGGNRCAIPRHIINLLIVWLLTGIWHGADWSFVVWGLGYFLLLLLEKYVPLCKKLCNKWYGHLYTLFFVNLLWIPFRADNLHVAADYIRGMFVGSTVFKIERRAISFLPFLIILILLCFSWERVLSKCENKNWFKIMKGLIIMILFILAICAIINSSYTPYIYGNF